MGGDVKLRYLLLFLFVMACGPTEPGGGGGDDSGGGDDAPAPDAEPDDPVAPDARPGGPIDAPPTGDAEPGSACSCDADCADEGTHDGVCIYGICMTEASGACASGGSQGECPAGSRCWGLTGYDGGSLCWPDCDAHTCAGTCDGDGSCVPTADDNCDPTCGSACSCTETSCGDGMSCVGGECVPDAGGGPGPGPGPDCPGLPPLACTGTTCGSLVVFNPRTNTAWDDYPINGETAANQYRSYLRRELMMIVSYATSKTACKAAAWTSGIGGALGLGDMSEANGAIPGTSIGDPGHPAGTHTNGFDIDLAYYQTGTSDNRLRPICDHTDGATDAYHCVAPPHLLDTWRTAMFLGSVFESDRTRVIGVDGQAGPLLQSAIGQLCEDDWLPAAACNNISLAYETTDTGLGWFHFHHHHAHISLLPASAAPPPSGAVKALPGRPAPGLHKVVD
jgi:hypothetical protein